MKMTTVFEWGRWRGLAKLIWGLARERGITITWFRRTYLWVVWERIEVQLESEPEAVLSFQNAVGAAMG
jgi:hypothetical protein